MSAWESTLDLPRFTEPALCAQADPEAFLPEKGGSSRAAKRLCARCPARIECLAYALEHQLVQAWDGIWGGTSPGERRKLLQASAVPKRRRVAKCGTTGGYQAHRRSSEPTCEACREAYRIAKREYRTGRSAHPSGEEAA